MTAHETVVQVRALGKEFQRRGEVVQALTDVSFSIGRGEVVGFLGPNGAGKTTTIRILLGLRRATRGEICITARRVGFVLDVPALYPHFTLERNLEFYSELLGLAPRAWEAHIPTLGLSDVVKVRVRELSLGMKKRAELARALLGEPDLLLLVDHASALDQLSPDSFREALRA